MFLAHDYLRRYTYSDYIIINSDNYNAKKRISIILSMDRINILDSMRNEKAIKTR